MRKISLFLLLTFAASTLAFQPQHAVLSNSDMPSLDALSWYKSEKWKHGWNVKGYDDMDIQTFYEQYSKAPAMYDSIFCWLASIDPINMEPSNSAMKWSHAYAKILNQQLRTPENCQWEQHRRTIDLQWDVTGSERYHMTRMPERLEQKNEYNEKKDVQNFTWDKKRPPLPDECRIMDSNAETFYLFFPNDIHQACGIAKEPCIPRKVVVKIDYLK